MKKNTVTRLLIVLPILIFTFNFGQKTEFNVPKNIAELRNTIFDFKNDFTRYDVAADAAAGDTEFTTNVDLYDLTFDSNKKNPYLNLALKKGAKPKQFIQKAIWNISMKKVSAKSTKVSVVLEEIIPDSWSEKEIDVNLTKSTGELEKELKEFLLNAKSKELSEGLIAVDDSSIDAETVAMMNTQADAQIAAVEAKQSQKKMTSKYLQNLFAKKQFINFPTSADQFTKLLKTDPTELDCETCKNGKYSNWDFENFNMIYAEMTSGEEYYAIQYYGQDSVSGLPYGLVFNDSSPSECKDKFARYNAQLYQTSINVTESSADALTVVTFKMNTSFVRLEFGNQYLTRIVISNKEL